MTHRTRLNGTPGEHKALAKARLVTGLELVATAQSAASRGLCREALSNIVAANITLAEASTNDKWATGKARASEAIHRVWRALHEAERMMYKTCLIEDRESAKQAVTRTRKVAFAKGKAAGTRLSRKKRGK